MASKDYFVSCTKYVPTNATNTAGKPYKTYSTSSTIYGYLGKRSEKEVREGDKATIETFYNFLSSDFDLAYKDRILYEGKYYEVANDPIDTAHKGDHVKCKLKKISNIRQ